MSGPTLFIVVSMFIDAMGFGLIVPVAPKLIMSLTGTDLTGAAPIAGYLMVAYACMQFVFAPVIGALSDRFGRRPVLLISMGALAFDYLLMSVAPSIGWLFVGRLIAGIAGATYPTANAALCDLHPPALRAKYFGMIGGAWGVGFIIGPALGGLLSGFGLRTPFQAAAALAAFNLLLGLVVFPETLPTTQRRAFVVARAHLFGAIGQVRHHPGLPLLLGVAFLYQIAHDAMPATWTFFTMSKFAWSVPQVGISLAVIGVTTAIVQGGLIGPIIARIGEARAAGYGFLAGIGSLAGYAFAPASWVIYPLIAIGAFFGLTMPSIRSIMSSKVPANAQGELQGAMSGVMSVSAVISPFAMTQLFHWATRPGVSTPFPGAPMLLAAVLLAAAAILFTAAVRNRLQPG
jgi:DHA1 family tetracycline resistance protein-like MFS transporter